GAVRLVAFEYLEKRFDRDQVRHVLQRAGATRASGGASVGAPGRLLDGAAATTSSDAPPDSDPSIEVGMIGTSSSMEQVREIVRTAAASPSTVLITGESGTGKELVARALHLG